MVLLSQTYDGHGRVLTPTQLIDQVRNVESVMSARGWPVIGSLYKASKLHPWKEVTAAQLHTWAQDDFAHYRANSLNLRLKDHQIIALDCDFNDPYLMRAFCDGVRGLMLLDVDQVYTCTGKKGGKLFFKLDRRTSRSRMPRLPKLVGYSKGHAGDSAFKQELELKTDLSTVAGFHSVTETGDIVLYARYSHYPYIIDARPQDLATITRADLTLISSLFNRLLVERGFVDQDGKPIESQVHHQLVRSCAAAFLAQVLEAGSPKSVVVELNEQVHPMLSDFEFHDAWSVISTVAYGQPCYDARLKPDVDFLAQLYQRCDLPALRNLARYFDQYLNHMRSKLVDLARRHSDKVPPESVTDNVFALYHLILKSGILDNA